MAHSKIFSESENIDAVLLICPCMVRKMYGDTEGGEEMRGTGEGRLEGRVRQLRDKGRGWDFGRV